MEREFLTVKEVSEITGLSIHTVRNRINKGTFKTLPRKRGDKVLIFKDSVLGGNHDRKS